MKENNYGGAGLKPILTLKQGWGDMILLWRGWVVVLSKKQNKSNKTDSGNMTQSAEVGGGLVYKTVLGFQQ